LIPWGGSGGDLEGLLLAGLNVVAIDVDSEMIDAMTRRITIIQGRSKDKTVEKTCAKYYSIGVKVEEDDEDDDEEEQEEEEAGGEK
jgi:hypothetical protein